MLNKFLKKNVFFLYSIEQFELRNSYDLFHMSFVKKLKG